MQGSPTLFLGSFVRRYKRFFTDIIDEKGNLLTVHCPNTGSMKNCQVEGSECWYSLSDNPKRKLQGTLEIVTTSHGQLAGINTLNANRLVANALECKIIPELASYDTVSREVRYGSEKSRIDFFLQDSANHLPDCYVEVKSVTLDMGNGLAMFPDSVTARGTKHLRELMAMAESGKRAVLLFCVQLNRATEVEVAADIDPVYAETLTKAVSSGVEVIAWKIKIDHEGIVLDQQIDCLSNLPLMG